MTGVQLIVPLDDEVDGLEESKKGTKTASALRPGSAAESKMEVKKEGESAVAGDGKSSSAVLSNELREQFETMKSIWRQARRPSADDLLGNEDDEDDGSSDASNPAAQEQQQPAGEEVLRRKQRETALETALAVDAEISRWQNGIAELEAMLAAEEGSSDSDVEEDRGDRRRLQNNHQGQPLQQQQGVLDPRRGHPQGHRPPLIQFPNLPPVVASEDDEYDSSDAS
ncbi:MAG: hypothetical protein SGILL_003546 [Bacillariaceae sp.]